MRNHIIKQLLEQICSVTFQAPEQDREVQHPEGVQVCPLQEGLLQVLICSLLYTEYDNKSWPLEKLVRQESVFEMKLLFSAVFHL